MSRSISICAACCNAADAGQFGEQAHNEAGCPGKGRCGCQHRKKASYAAGYPKRPAPPVVRVKVDGEGNLEHPIQGPATLLIEPGSTNSLPSVTQA